MRFRREADLYPALKQHFLRQGYDVYAEVPAAHGGFLDLLAVRGERSTAVELKLRFSRRALKQATRNRHFVWQSFVAIPEPKILDARVRSLFQRRRIGLLLVSPQGVTCAVPPKEAAPGYSLREVFGSHLTGELAQLYAAAAGGLPTTERISAYRVLAERVHATILDFGGIAATEHILEATNHWNYYRGKRAGLTALLAARYKSPCQDLWAAEAHPRPAIHALRLDRVVRAQSASLKVLLDERMPADARPGDILWFVQQGRIQAHARLKFAEQHPVKQTPQRELRAGPAVFSPFRVGDVAPKSVTVLALAGYRMLPNPKAFRKPLAQSWQTLRPRRASALVQR